MKKLKIYLDTSVYSALYDSRDLVRQKQTKEFWNNIDSFELYYSDINLVEINGVADQKLRKKLEILLKNGNKINISSEVRQLSRLYIKEDLMPEKYESDAMHIAFTSVYFIDI